MLLEINDFVLCLGVGKADERGALNAHLFRLKKPIDLITRPWQTGEEFIIGKWYKKDKSNNKKYVPINDDIVRTTIIQNTDLMGNSQKTILEVLLLISLNVLFKNLNLVNIASVLSGRFIKPRTIWPSPSFAKSKFALNSNMSSFWTKIC